MRYVSSEYRPIKTVLLYKPLSCIHQVPHPEKILHVAKVEYPIIVQEYDHIVDVYDRLNIRTLLQEEVESKGDETRYLCNIMFARDQFFMTPSGAIMAKMAFSERSKEPQWAEKIFTENSIPFRQVIQGEGTFEGADALWVNENLVVVGVGNRTNETGFLQLQSALKEDHIECLAVAAPKGALHLLGALQIVDKDLALVRTEVVDRELITLVQKEGIQMLPVPESVEVTERHGMNFVVIAPRTLIIPAGCSMIRDICQKAQLTIVAEVEISEYCHAGGGLACATGIVERT